MLLLLYSSLFVLLFGFVVVLGVLLLISGCFNNVLVGVLIVFSRLCCVVCNCDVMVVFVVVYDFDVEFSVCMNC